MGTAGFAAGPLYVARGVRLDPGSSVDAGSDSDDSPRLLSIRSWNEGYERTRVLVRHDHGAQRLYQQTSDLRI